ncbi:MAG: polysaccharide deacetylase family protein [Desulfobacterales bacterium]|nr:polysaccharide deacetylase family protein [Desulfobacterales bacterium]
MALTFDDGPDLETTPRILRLLSSHNAKATFFVLGKKASRHRGLIKEMLSDGHSLGNHTFTHDNYIMLKSGKKLSSEIQSTRDVLKEFGVVSTVFRPPAGITSPRLKVALKGTDMLVVNFSCRAYDWANNKINNLAKKVLARIRPGDILLLHDISPKDKTLIPQLLDELEQLLMGIKDKGLSILPLAEIIGEQVMTLEKGK